jgi:uncharacterized surface protein with fasciclin (FAS1) repeats
MSPTRLLTASAALALVAALAAPAAAQTPATAKTEGAARAATGKATTDAPARTQVQGTAKAVTEAAPSVATGARPAADQAPAAAPAAPAAPAATMAKPVAVNGDLVDTLKLNGQFTTFTGGIDATNLAGLLKTNKNLTVFAPTDAAFAAMPPADLAKLKSDKTAMQKFILHHIVNAPIPSTKIKGAKGPVPSGAGDQILLDGSDEAGALKVDGATIIQADVQTGSGLLQVVDHVLVPGQGDTSTTAAAPTGQAASSSATATAPATGTKPK